MDKHIKDWKSAWAFFGCFCPYFTLVYNLIFRRDSGYAVGMAISVCFLVWGLHSITMHWITLLIVNIIAIALAYTVGNIGMIIFNVIEFYVIYAERKGGL